MKRNDIIRRSVYIIREYYKGNLSPFFNSIDENKFFNSKVQNEEGSGTIGIVNYY